MSDDKNDAKEKFVVLVEVPTSWGEGTPKRLGQLIQDSVSGDVKVKGVLQAGAYRHSVLKTLIKDVASILELFCMVGSANMTQWVNERWGDQEIDAS